MNKERVIERLRELHGARDVEAAHMTADEILCDLLESLGYREVVVAWEQVPKWFA